MFFNMSGYRPSFLSAAFVWLSALGLTLAPGIYGLLLYGKFFQAVTGIGPNDPMPPLFGLVFFAIPMFIPLTLGMVIGGVAWTVVINLILPLDAARYWARYPSPHIPILTPIFTKLNDWILSLRSRKQ